MKKLLLVLTIIFCISSMVSFAGDEKFGKSSMLVSPMFGINKYAIPFGASVEYGISDNIGIGATLMIQSWSDQPDPPRSGVAFNMTLITPSIQVLYHTDGIGIENIDLYTGFNIGYSIFSFSLKDDQGVIDSAVGSSGLHFSSLAGIRYYLSSGMALTATVKYSAIGSWKGVNTLVGVSFKLK